MAFNQRNKRKTPLTGLAQTADVVLTSASWVSVVGLWAAAGSVYISPADFRMASVLGIAFPVLLCGIAFCFFLCLLFAPRRTWISILGVVCAAGSVRSYFPVNFIHAEPSDSTFSVMTYNCQGFPYMSADDDKKGILQYLYNQDIDVFCYQEANPNFDDWRELHPEFARRYPYYAVPYPDCSTRQGLYSRYPIMRTELVTSNGTNAVIAFWLKFPAGDSLLVLNTHLKSNQLTPEDREQYSKLVKSTDPHHHPDSTFMTSRTLVSKISLSAGVRSLMADTLADYLDHFRHVPTIVCGDFNDTPISYSAYRMKRAGLTDAFRAEGNGMGRSFNQDAIAVRIDHQFCSDHFEPYSAKIDESAEWSDHYPLIVRYNRVQPSSTTNSKTSKP